MHEDGRRPFEHPEINFTNILGAALTLEDPKSAKNTVKLSVFLCFWDLRV